MSSTSLVLLLDGLEPDLRDTAFGLQQCRVTGDTLHIVLESDV
jgi:hypothetical protein